MKQFQELPVFVQSHELTLEMYKLTQTFPSEEKYGLSSQIKRCASSVPANIVEGLHRNTKKELIVFLYNARGSAGELKYHILLAKDLSYINNQKYNVLDTKISDVIRQLNGWIKSEKVKLNIKN